MTFWRVIGGVSGFVGAGNVFFVFIAVIVIGCIENMICATY